MNSDTLNKLSPEAREFVINSEARLRELDEELAEIDLLLKNIEKGDPLI